MAKCPVSVAFDQSAKPTLIYCGQWRCPRCAKRLAGKWAKRGELALRSWDDSKTGEAWFLTLTLGRAFNTSRQGFQAIPGLWDATRKAYQRYYPAFTYLAFVEGQANRGGMPHFHILSPQMPPTKRGRHGFVTSHGVHDFAAAYGWGFQAQLDVVTGPQAAVYISKYASKGDPAMPRGFRRVRSSRDFPALPDLGGQPLLVPAYGEDIGHFVARVADVSGVPPETVYKDWTKAQQLLYTERNIR